MIDPLWDNLEAFKNASDERIIQALLHPPTQINPRFFNYLERERLHLKVKFLNIYYSGKIPEYVKKIHRL